MKTIRAYLLSPNYFPTGHGPAFQTLTVDPSIYTDACRYDGQSGLIPLMGLMELIIYAYRRRLFPHGRSYRRPHNLYFPERSIHLQRTILDLSVLTSALTTMSPLVCNRNLISTCNLKTFLSGPPLNCPRSDGPGRRTQPCSPIRSQFGVVIRARGNSLRVLSFEPPCPSLSLP